MQRLVLAILAALLFAPLVTAQVFGAGPIGFEDHVGPNGLTTAEPTIGIPWDTDSVFYQSVAQTHRITFDASGEASWVEVTPPYQVPTNLDPMLVADEDTGRVWAGGLHGACSVMMYSDDDGETWLPAGNMCSGADFDHQSLGSGPSTSPLAGAFYPHAQYYCGQGGTISCATSYDGGQTWTPFVQEQTVCEGFHGHIRVSRVSAMMAVPVADCGGELGMLTTLDGVTYTAKTIPDSEEWVGGFDPSLQFGRDEGWLWYGQASENGIHVSLSKDDGDSWEPIGADGNASLDVGQFHDPPIIAGTFADVQVGDDDRVAFSFIGIEETDNATLNKHLRSPAIYSCYNKGEGASDGWEDGFPVHQTDMVWNYYVAMTYDGGASWTVEKISDDPVQVGGVYDAVTDNSGGCRNLLDFNDMDIDSTGRVYIGYADGCIAECAADPHNASGDTPGYRADGARLFRQVAGKGLFHAYDTATPDDLDGDGVPNEEDPDVDGDGVPNEEDADADGDGVVDETPADPDGRQTPMGAFLPVAALLGAGLLRRR